ncbi:MAG: signal peptidase I [Anaerolineales bacterium]|nr:signal peptidase I [Anaerolineales bacterium]
MGKQVQPEQHATQPSGPARSSTTAVGRIAARLARELISTVLPAVLIALFINVFVARAMVVDGPSMQPNLTYNQRVIVEKASYHLLHGPRRGDVIVVEVPGEPQPLIKRVVALAGETVEVREGSVFIDGQALAEPWGTLDGGPSLSPSIVPPLHVFVLGDNRANSLDSRYFGPVSLDIIVGRALFSYWPPSQIGPIR